MAHGLIKIIIRDVESLVDATWQIQEYWGVSLVGGNRI